jgi:hypothetical protein
VQFRELEVSDAWAVACTTIYESSCDGLKFYRIEDVARTMALLLDGHPKLIHRFNRFLPKYWQIEIEEVEEEEEKHHPDESGSGSRTDQAQGSGTSA